MTEDDFSEKNISYKKKEEKKLEAKIKRKLGEQERGSSSFLKIL